MTNARRRSELDPEDGLAAARAEAEERRTGRVLWGGRNIAGLEVWVDTVVFNYFGKVRDLRGGVLWLDDASRVYDDTENGASDTRRAGTISISVASITMVAIKGELTWYQ